TAGVPGDTCVAGSPAADDSVCNGIDDDCDGTTDEDFVMAPTSCGVGACSASGTTTCVGGVVGDSCTPGSPAANDATCDGIDDDCDGTTDEDFASTPTSCGVGACTSSGATTCTAGVPGDTCVAGSPAADDATCDGIDDDCDGSTDEDFVSQQTTCGVGDCWSVGQTECTGGSLIDTCTPLPPGPNDWYCDGIDEDCDGLVDEDYPSQSTVCGTGACTAGGELICVDGQEQNTCTPGTAAADDSLCNGIDDDCDGSTDEDFAPTTTSCGTGACTSSGTTTCTAGVPGDTCTPGTPAADDVTCDGVDDDCDGSTDEDYPETPTSCGVGDCAGNVGDLICDAGQVTDTCDPYFGAVTEVCDGADNDCDGVTDNGDPGGGDACSTGLQGSCDSGLTSCQQGTVVCVATSSGSPEVCGDGLDNDCDGVVDNEPPEVASDLEFLDTMTLAWSASPVVNAYNLYEGTLQSGGWVYDQVCTDPGLANPTTTVTNVPAEGEVLYYLVGGVNGCGEGPLGTDSDGFTIPNAMPCP
ncbi:MAG TPA: MopE-related protein, partial [Candidatus Saccharimonadales bacterium]|nr:MopE-related protein [Candidatus Saccharimonadales bacterium]